MIEPAQWLHKHAAQLGYRPEHVGPASVDLCLHGTINERVYHADLVGKPTMRHTYTQVPSMTFRFMPGRFYLCSTEEYIRVPDTHCAQVMMRSSLARKGLGHKMAGWVDAGFEGQITLELEATIPVDVAIGERIVQLIYCRLSEPTTQPYRGRYLGQQGPTEAYTEDHHGH